MALIWTLRSLGYTKALCYTISMNKDVIYIEPEDDITDILANIKTAKNKIVALVPPKKAGVLRSAVNFKLIAKTARQNNKAIVLISSDESLLKLASAVKMPVAKTLQSKPQIPEGFSVKNLSDEPSDVIEAEKPVKKTTEAQKAEVAKAKAEEKPEDKEGEDIDAEVRPAFKTAKDAPKKEKEIETIELDEEDPKEKRAVRGAKKGLPVNVPNILKYRKFIIGGACALVAILVFCIWAFVIAPAAKIDVKIKTSAKNFSEEVSFVLEEANAKVEDGTFYVESKSIEKKAETEYEATGELDKGQKATGTIQLTIPSGTKASCDKMKGGISVNAGSIFIFGEVAFKATDGVSLSAGDLDEYVGGVSNCTVNKNITLGTVSVEAVENGDKYNIAATTSGWSLNSDAWYAKSLSFSSSEMTGGTSEIAKVVSKEDIERAKSSLTLPSDKEVLSEFNNEFGSEYLIIQSSLETGEVKYTPTPDVEGEIENGKKAKLVAEKKYTVYAVKRSDINEYICKKALEDLGDNTQTIYSSGVTGFQKKLTESDDVSANSEKDSVFFESFKRGDASITAKLKSTVLVAPEVNEAMVLEKALGNKKHDVYTALSSINGVQSVEVQISPSFSSKVPKDENRVKVTIELVQ